MSLGAYPVANPAKKLDGRGGSPNAGRKPDAERASDDYTSYNRARAKREMHNAKIAEYEERRLAGELVDAAKLAQANQAVVANAKARLLSIPSKTAPMLVGMESIAEIEDIMRREIYEALEELARGS
jgi:phage terminase Nu1 subunit (DNA packaging protein)